MWPPTDRHCLNHMCDVFETLTKLSRECHSSVYNGIHTKETFTVCIIYSNMGKRFWSFFFVCDLRQTGTRDGHKINLWSEFWGLYKFHSWVIMLCSNQGKPDRTSWRLPVILQDISKPTYSKVAETHLGGMFSFKQCCHPTGSSKHLEKKKKSGWFLKQPIKCIWFNVHPSVGIIWICTSPFLRHREAVNAENPFFHALCYICHENILSFDDKYNGNLSPFCIHTHCTCPSI